MVFYLYTVATSFKCFTIKMFVMSIQDPKTKAGQQQHQASQHTPDFIKGSQQQKEEAFSQGAGNNSGNQQFNTSGHESGQPKGYKEKNPNQPQQPGQEQPKVTNQENDITNTDQQNRVDEEPVDERSANPGIYSGGGDDDDDDDDKKDKDPEIDMPIPDPEPTEKKLPTMKGE